MQESAMANPAGEATASGCPRSQRRRRVLLFPVPFQGHLNPMLQLADVLHSRGFAVTIFHAAFSAPDPARRPVGYRFVPVGAGVAAGDLVPTGSDADFAGALLRIDELLRAPFEDVLREALAGEEEGEDPPACLVLDSNLRGMQVVADGLGVPTLVLRTGGAACLVAYMAFPALCAKGLLPPPPQGTELDMPLDELPPLRRRDMVFSATTTHETMSTCLERILEASRCSSGLILNTFSDLEGPELQRIAAAGVPAVYAVGPLDKMIAPPGAVAASAAETQDRISCLEWLDKQEADSVLYVSLGSLASMNQEELVETAWGLANSGVPFLWVIRPDMVQSSSSEKTTATAAKLPDGFEDAARRSASRGMVVPWSPQQRVLRHRAVGGFWTHNGWNSTVESICEGVPMICRPHFADQMINARYVEEVWNVGFALQGNKLERGKIESSVRKLMCGHEGGEMRRRATELKKKADMAVEQGGSSQTAIDLLVNRISSFSLGSV